MEWKSLIESIGLSARELRSYVIEEIDEFLAADTPEEQDEEFADILFALCAFTYSHSRRHHDITSTSWAEKLTARLRTYATISRKPAIFADADVSTVPFDIVHYAFGNFVGNWSDQIALKNGTIAEITLLITTPPISGGPQRNHLILTFDDVDQIEFDRISLGERSSSGNAVLGRVPGFLFEKAKQENEFRDLEGLLTLQVLAALDQVRLAEGAIAHLHSWETGFLMNSDEFRGRVNGSQTYFSPYLTINRLMDFMLGGGDDCCTLSTASGEVASHYERAAIDGCSRVVLESERDATFYRSSGYGDKIQLVSFSPSKFELESRPSGASLDFVAGGRPVREKGFLELCDRIAELLPWAQEMGLSVSLQLLCRERKRHKGKKYLETLERRIEERGLLGIVAIDDKVSVPELEAAVRGASALIVPSLYDPFCLLPTYAMHAGRVSFVSCYAGISESVTSVDYVFDPLEPHDLLRAVRVWYEYGVPFRFENPNLPFNKLYVS